MDVIFIINGVENVHKESYRKFEGSSDLVNPEQSFRIGDRVNHFSSDWKRNGEVLNVRLDAVFVSFGSCHSWFIPEELVLITVPECKFNPGSLVNIEVKIEAILPPEDSDTEPWYAVRYGEGEDDMDVIPQSVLEKAIENASYPF